MGCVYLITCSASGKRYVGLTKFSADVRFASHLRDALRGKPTALHRAIRKHGASSFSVETIFESNDRTQLCTKEQDLIAKLGTRRPLGYNITGGGEAPFGQLNPRFGTKHTAATKKKMSENNAMRNPVHRAKLQGVNHPMYGKKHSTAALDKMAAGKRGRIKMHDTETLRECDVDPKYEGLFIELGYVRGRPPMSEDWVRHMGEAARGRRHI